MASVLPAYGLRMTSIPYANHSFPYYSILLYITYILLKSIRKPYANHTQTILKNPYANHTQNYFPYHASNTHHDNRHTTKTWPAYGLRMVCVWFAYDLLIHLHTQTIRQQYASDTQTILLIKLSIRKPYASDTLAIR